MSEDPDFNKSSRELIKRGEGCVSHMYLDTVGKVTVGVGNMLPSVETAVNLPFHNRDTGKNASVDEIKLDYDLVAKQESGKLASSYKQFTKLDLSDEYIDRLLDKRITKFEASLRIDFEHYDQYPDAAKLGLMDMVFNLGNSGLVNKFPSFTRAARQQDWAKCSKECYRHGISKNRNEEVIDLFKSIA